MITRLRRRFAACAALLLFTALGAHGAVNITTQPQASTKLAGEVAVFTVQATGTGTLTYQWKKDGADIAGATQQGLVLNPVTAGDAATYSVVVSDADPSSATSSGAALTVRAAVPGDVDFSFAGEGGATNGTVNAVKVQSDGKVIIGGSFTTVRGAVRGRVARLNADGTTDYTFGHDLAGASTTVRAVAVQSDGKVLIGGDFTTVNGTVINRIARLNSDGTLDTTFGNGLAGANGTVRAVAVQSDGKVVIGGDFTTVNGTTRGRIAQLNSDGTLDTAFGNGLAGANTTVNAVAVQSDGKVFIGGNFSTVNGTARGYIARLTSTGTLDPTFLSYTGPDSFVYAVAVQSDGKMLIGGSFTTVNSTIKYRIARINIDGSLDTTFGNGLTGANSTVQAVAVQSDGKVLIGGDFGTVNGTARSRIARLNSNGSLDTTFGNPNVVGSPVYAMAVQSDGKVLIGGIFSSVNGTARDYIARLTSTGTLDTTFDTGANGTVRAVAVQSDGKVVIGGGFTTVNGTARGYIARLNSDGTLDTTFGNGLAGANSTVRAVAVQSDGKVLIGGDFTTVNGTARGYMARLNSDGTLDTTFGTGANGIVTSVAVQSDGTVVIGGGFTTVNGTARGYIARLTSNGSLDTTFGNGLAGANGGVWAVAMQSGGKVVIGGDFTTVNGTARGYIARLNSDGTLDTTFGNGLAGANSSVYAVAAQSDGKVLIGGIFGTVNGTARNYIARLTSTGSLDTTFGNGLTGANSTVQAVAVQSDGKVLIGGSFNTVNGTARYYIARLTSTGSLDTTFGNGLTGANHYVYAVAVQSDGKVLIGGVFSSVNSTARGSYARLLGDTSTTAPTVSTPTSASVTAATATLGGSVNSDGGATITARGVVYSPTSLNSNPLIGGANVTNLTTSGTTGVFTTSATGLSAHTGYTFKAYATNSVGTTYTSTATFTTLNTLPTAPAGSTTGTTGDQQTYTVSFPATDADGDAVAITSAASGTGVTVNSFTGTSVTFTPGSSFTGSGDFTYTVSDGIGTATGTITVTVTDNDAPVVAAHANVTVDATSAAGATVTYAAGSASDNVTGSPTITYSQNSGTTFPIGTTTVTISATDAANNTGTGTFSVTVLSVQQSWRQTYFGTTSNTGNAADTADWDSDGITNLAEFGFGTLPDNNSSGPPVIEVTSGVITRRGTPTVNIVKSGTSFTYNALFGRRKDWATAGLTFTVQFSGDLGTWYNSTATPTVIADDGTVEAVTVRYPFFVGGKKAQFFRVVVGTTP